MKIYIIAHENFDSWLTKMNLDKEVKDLTDDEFIAICNEYQEGWHFDSWEEFIDAFNNDSPFAPEPSHHYIRVVEGNEQ